MRKHYVGFMLIKLLVVIILVLGTLALGIPAIQGVQQRRAEVEARSGTVFGNLGDVERAVLAHPDVFQIIKRLDDRSSPGWCFLVLNQERQIRVAVTKGREVYLSCEDIPARQLMGGK